MVCFECFVYVGPPEANLFVFNLPPDVDDKHLRELFAPYGEILSAKVMIVIDSHCRSFLKRKQT